MSDIFVSYTHADKNKVRRVVDLLTAKGWSVFWDGAIAPGDNWDTRIEDELTRARCVIVVWSPESITHYWVREEAHAARRKDKLIPISIDNAEPPLGFASLQTVKFDPFFDRADESPAVDLIDSLKRKLEEPVRTDKPAPGKPAAIPEAEAASPMTELAKGPFGRSLHNFKDPKNGGSGLLPAEETLLRAVARGDLCDLGGYTATRELRKELDQALSNPDGEAARLAVEVVASPSRIFDWNVRESDEDRARREALEARVNALPRIVQEFLRELPDYAAGHPRAPKDQEIAVATNPGLLKPIIAELQQRMESELWHWRQVDRGDPAVHVRGALLRFLALGGDETAPVHEKGIRLEGAYVEGALDLTGCVGVRRLEFRDCIFADRVEMSDARLQRFSLSGSRVPGLNGVRCTTEGSVFFDNGFLSTDAVRLVGSAIGGSLDCSDGTFRGGLNCANARIASDVYLSSSFRAEEEVKFDNSDIGGDLSCWGGSFRNRADGGQWSALTASGARIGGSVHLGGGFSAEGCVSLWSAEIHKALGCSGGTFRNRTADGEGEALSLERATIHGSVFLRQGFAAEGLVKLVGARIGGILDCHSSTFDNLVPAKLQPPRLGRRRLAATALDLTNAVVADAICLCPSDNEAGTAAEMRGSLDLVGAHTRQLVDHPDSWPERVESGPDGQRLICSIALDGFTYERFSEGAPTHANGSNGSKGRLHWLGLQPVEHMQGDFRPQPYEQLIKVLRGMGHDEDAHTIATAMHKLRRRARWARAWRGLMDKPRHWWGWILKPATSLAVLVSGIAMLAQWLVWDLLLGGRYAKLKPLLVLLVLLFGCAWFYDRVAAQGSFVPANPALYNNLEVRRACSGKDSADITAPIDWLRCKKAPPELNPFRPLAYSLDQMIPFVQLGQKRDWQPADTVIRLQSLGMQTVELPSWTTLAVTWGQTIGSMVLLALYAAVLGGFVGRD